MRKARSIASAADTRRRKERSAVFRCCLFIPTFSLQNTMGERQLRTGALSCLGTPFSAASNSPPAPISLSNGQITTEVELLVALSSLRLISQALQFSPHVWIVLLDPRLELCLPLNAGRGIVPVGEPVSILAATRQTSSAMTYIGKSGLNPCSSSTRSTTATTSSCAPFPASAPR